MSSKQYEGMIGHILSKVNEIEKRQKDLEGKYIGLKERIGEIATNIGDTRRFMYAVDETLYDHEQRFSALGKKMERKN